MNAAITGVTLGQPTPLASSRPLAGDSPAMREVFRLIARVGPTEASVLLTGESGSGKELAAKAIHERSSRRDGAFISWQIELTLCHRRPPRRHHRAGSAHAGGRHRFRDLVRAHGRAERDRPYHPLRCDGLHRPDCRGSAGL